MLFNVLTLFPDFFHTPLTQGVLGRACTKKLIQCQIISIRQFSTSDYQSVDDRPFGGGDGMVLSYQPLKSALESVKNRGRVIYLSPQGRVWNHHLARKFVERNETLTLVCGRYAGVDSRWIHQYVEEEISIGDYILSGGEYGALVIMDTISRFIPGVLGHPDSSQQETFEKDFLLEHPQWTRPQKIKGFKIPDVFFSGHHKKIEQARYYLSLLRTHKQRPDLLKGIHKEKLKSAQEWLDTLSDEEKKACQLDFIQKPL